MRCHASSTRTRAHSSITSHKHKLHPHPSRTQIQEPSAPLRAQLRDGEIRSVICAYKLGAHHKFTTPWFATFSPRSRHRRQPGPCTVWSYYPASSFQADSKKAISHQCTDFVDEIDRQPVRNDDRADATLVKRTIQRSHGYDSRRYACIIPIHTVHGPG